MPCRNDHKGRGGFDKSHKRERPSKDNGKWKERVKDNSPKSKIKCLLCDEPHHIFKFLCQNKLPSRMKEGHMQQGDHLV